MIVWEQDALLDRQTIYTFLYEYNPLAAEQADRVLVQRIESLETHPEMGVKREGLPGRLLIIPEISLIAVYWFDLQTIHILRILHQKQQFP